MAFRARGRASPVNLQTSVRRVHDLLRGAIRLGLLEENEHLVEQTLVTAMSTSRNSVREALRMLAQDGLVDREPRRGTTVSGKINQIAAGELVPTLTSGNGVMAPVKVDLIEYRVVPTTRLIGARLQIDDPEVLMIEQLARLDGVPIYVRAGYQRIGSTPQLLAERVAAQGRAPTPMAEAFASLFGVPLGDSEMVIEARACDERTGRLLEVAEGSPTLVRELLLQDWDGLPRELSFTHYRADRVALSATSWIDRPEQCMSSRQALGMAQ